jgi:hypothetical protein
MATKVSELERMLSHLTLKQLRHIITKNDFANPREATHFTCFQCTEPILNSNIPVAKVEIYYRFQMEMRRERRAVKRPQQLERGAKRTKTCNNRGDAPRAGSYE